MRALNADSPADRQRKQSRNRSSQEDGEAGSDELAGVSLHSGTCEVQGVRFEGVCDAIRVLKENSFSRALVC